MKQVLQALDEFEEEHMDWLLEAGQEHTMETGEVLIRQGEPIDAIYIVAEGEFAITSTRSDAGEVARVGAGEVLGEISYLDGEPPTATVTAVNPATVLEIPRAPLSRKVQGDPRFAASFYRAMAVSLANRLRMAE